jgi:hypothetical protein
MHGGSGESQGYGGAGRDSRAPGLWHARSVSARRTSCARRPRAAKFGNEKSAGYDSKREARRAEELRLLESAGEISDLQDKPKFLLIPKQGAERAVHYIADFAYRRAGELVVEDCKGFRTDVYVIKRKLMLFVHGIAVLET